VQPQRPGRYNHLCSLLSFIACLAFATKHSLTFPFLFHSFFLALPYQELKFQILHLGGGGGKRSKASFAATQYSREPEYDDAVVVGECVLSMRQVGSITLASVNQFLPLLSNIYSPFYSYFFFFPYDRRPCLQRNVPVSHSG
jgi:hypothetical protein